MKVVLLLMLVVLFVVAELAWGIRNPLGKRAIALLLCAAMISSYIPVMDTAKADTAGNPVLADGQVQVNGTKAAQIGAVTYSAVGGDETAAPAYEVDASSDRIRVKNGDCIAFEGTISAPEGETISWVRVDVYDANSEEPYTVGAEYYRADGLKAEQFDLSEIPVLEIGEAFGHSDYTLVEGGRYIVMFCVGDSNGNGFADEDMEIVDDQGPAFVIEVKLSPLNCKHPHSDYRYVLHSSEEIRRHSYGDALTHQVEPLYERYCGLCDMYLMNIWGQGTPEEHTMVNGTCSECGYAEVEGVAPVVGSISVSAGEVFFAGAEVTFGASASDDSALAKLELFIDDELMQAENPAGEAADIAFTTSALAVGEHEVTVVVTDAEGLQNQRTLAVMVLQEDPASCAHVNTEIVPIQGYVPVDDESHQLITENWTHCVDCDTDVGCTEEMDEPMAHDEWHEGVCQTCGHSLTAAVFSDMILLEMISEQALINADVDFKVTTAGADLCTVTFYDENGEEVFYDEIALEEGVATFSGWAGSACTEKLVVSCLIDGTEYTAEMEVAYQQIGQIVSAPVLNLTETPVVGQDYTFVWDAVAGAEWYNLNITNPRGESLHYGGVGNSYAVPGYFFCAEGECEVLLEATCAGYESTYAAEMVTVSDTAQADDRVRVTLSAAQADFGGEVTVNVSADNATKIELYYNGRFDKEADGNTFEETWNVWEDITLAARALIDGEWTGLSESVTLDVIMPEVNLPETVEAGKELTLTLSHAQNAHGYCLVDDEYYVWDDETPGSFVIPGSFMTTGAHTLKLFVFANDGMGADWAMASRTYSFTVQGEQSGAPVVAASATEALLGEKVTFTVTAPGAQLLSMKGYGYREYEPGSDTVTINERFYEEGTYSVSFAALIDGKWSAYSAPINITVTKLGKLGAPVMTIPESITAGDDLTVSWNAVEHAEEYCLVLSIFDAEGNTNYVTQEDTEGSATSATIEGRHILAGDYELILYARAIGWEDGEAQKLFTAEQGDKTFTYTVDSGNVTITGYVGSDSAVVIPAELDGCPVTEIGFGAFSGRRVTSVTLPASVREIANYAFEDCTLLETLTIGANVQVSEHAFDGCSSLTVHGYTGSSAEAAADYAGCTFVSIGELAEGPSFTVDKTEAVMQEDVTFTIAAPGATSLQMHSDYGVTEIEPQGDTTVYTTRFYSADTYEISFSALIDGVWSKQGPAQTITISDLGTLAQPAITAPDSVKAGESFDVSWTAVENAEEYSVYIRNDAVETYAYTAWIDDGRTSVTVPEGTLAQGEYTIEVRASAAGWNSSEAARPLTAEAPEEGKEFVYSVLSDNTAEITKYLGNASSLVIPSQIDGYTVSAIANGAFRESGIVSVTIPAGVDIDAWAFGYCSSLANVYMPKNAGSIDEYAFRYCGNVMLHVYKNSTAHSMALANSIPFVLYDEEPEASGITAAVEDGPYYIGEWVGFTVTVPEQSAQVRMYVDGEQYNTYTVGDSLTLNISYYPSGSETKTHYVQFSACVNDVWTALSDALELEVICYGELDAPQITLADEVYAGQDMTVTWTAIENADSYDVWLYWINGEDEEYLYGTQTEEASYTFGARTMNRTGALKVEVRAEGLGWNSSDRSEATTTAIALSEWVVDEDYWDGPAITGYLGSSTDVTVPDTIDGVAATIIGSDAFSGLGLTSVTLSESITDIEYSAFYGCSQLTKVVIPAGVTRIDSSAFGSCPSLTIYGYAGTTAQTYAQENNIPFVELDGAVKAPAFTLEPADIYLEETVIVKVENTEADRIRVYFEDYRTVEAAVTDGKAQVQLYSWYFDEVGTYQVKISGRVNGVWSAPSEAQTITVTLAGVLSAPEIEEIGTQAPRSVFRVRWLAAENAENYSVEFYDTEENMNAVASLYWDTDLVDEDGYCYVETDVSSLVEAGSYRVRLRTMATGYEDVYSETTVEIVAETEWLYTADDNGVTITGYTGSDTDVTVPEQIEGKPVIAIGANAFENDENLLSVSLPDSVTSIGESAFASCYALTTIDLSANVTSIGNYAFSYCRALDGVMLPDSLTAIGENAFASCYALSSIAVPQSVTAIGSYAFAYCDALTTVTLPDSLEQTTFDAFQSCENLQSIVIPSGVTTVGGFENCTSLQSVEMPSSVTELDSYAFAHCTALTNVSFVSQMTSIGSSAFLGCTGITEVVFGEALTSIPWSAFSGCTSLSKATIPETVTSISDNAFADCGGLTIYGYTNSMAESFAQAQGFEFVALGQAEPESSFTYTVKDGKATITEYIGTSEDVVIPDTIGGYPVAAIGNNAFVYTSAVSVTLPGTVQEIKPYAFAGVQEIRVNKAAWAEQYAFDLCYETTVYGYSGGSVEKAALHAGCTFVSLGELAAAPVLVVTPTELGYGETYSYTLSHPDTNVFRVSKLSMTPDGASTVTYHEDLEAGTYRGMANDFEQDYTLTLTASALINDVWSAVAEAQVDVTCNIVTSGDYQYIVQGAAAMIIDYLGTDTDVTVPEMIDGYEVTALNCDAFSDKGVISLTLPSTLERFGEYSGFDYGFDSLQSIYTPSSLWVREDAFEGCPDATVYGYSGSSVEAAALAAGCEFVSLGTLSADTPKVTITPTTVAYGEEYEIICELEGADMFEIHTTFASANDSYTYSMTEEAEAGILSMVWTTELYDEAPGNYTETYKVSARVNGAWTQYSAPQTVTVVYGEDTILSAPELHEIVSPVPSNEDLTISWDPVENAQEYEVWITPVTDVHYGAFEVTTSTPDATQWVIPAQMINRYFYGNELDEVVLKLSVTAKATGYQSATTEKEFTAYTYRLGEPALDDLPEKIVIGEWVELTWPAVENADKFDDETYELEVQGENGAAYGVTFSWTEEEGMVNCLSVFYDHIPAGTHTLRVSVLRDGTIMTYSECTINFVERYEYEVVDGNAVITAYNGSQAYVYLPSTLDDYPVVAIGDSAFEGNTAIKSVTMPDSVTEIGAKAFKNCTALETVNGPGVTSIGEEAFYGCSSLRDVNFYKHVYYIGGNAFYGASLPAEAGPLTVYISGLSGGSGVGSHANNEFIGEVHYGEGITEIPAYTHYANTNLDRVYLPTTLETIGAQAFAECGDLDYVKLYDGITFIADDAFANSPDTSFEIMVKDMDAVSYVEQYAIDHQIPYTKKLYTTDGPVVPELSISGGVLEETDDGYWVMINTPVQLIAVGNEAEYAIMYLDGQSIGTYEFMDSYAQTIHTFTEFGDVAFYAESYNGSILQEISATKTVHVVGTLLEADKTEVWTCEPVHFEVNTSGSDVAQFYADGELFAEAAVVDGKAELDYGLRKAGDRVITVKAGSYTSEAMIITVKCIGDLAVPVIEAEPVQLLASGMTLSWNAIEHAEGYVLRVRDESGAQILEQELTADTLSYTIANELLRGAGSYSAYVMAYGYQYDQSESEAVSVMMVEELQDAYFTIDKTQVTTGEPVTFSVYAPNATQAEFIVDGELIQTFDMSNNRLTFTRPFTKSGEREVTFRVLVDGEWSVPCDVQIVSVSSADRLAAPQPQTQEWHLLGSAVDVSWSAVEHAEGYVVRVYDGNAALIYENDITETAVTIPSETFISPAVYSIQVMAYGTGYDQSEGGATTTMLEHLPGPVITSPTHGGSIEETSTTLTWTEVDGALSYVVSLARRTDAVDANGNPVYEKVWASPNEVVNAGTDLSYPLSGLVYGESYRAAVGSVSEGTGLEPDAKVGWTECEFSVTLPQLEVVVTAEPSAAYEKEPVAITVVVAQAQSTAQMLDANGNVVEPSSDEVTDKGRELGYTVTENKQGEYTYKVVVTGTGELINAVPVEKTITVTYLDANAPRIEAVDVQPVSIWPGMPVTFTVTANANTQYVDVYLHEANGETLDQTITWNGESLYPSGSREFIYTRTYDAEGEYTLHFTPVNADMEWAEGYPVTVTVLPEGKVPDPVFTNIADGDVIVNAGFTIQWNPVEVAEGMSFGGYRAVLSVQQSDGGYAVVEEKLLGADEVSYALPQMAAGSSYQFELITLDKDGGEAEESKRGYAKAAFGFRTVPKFDATGIETSGYVGQPVTITWNPPVWNGAPDLKPDRYVIWWYGPGLDGGYAMEVPGDAAACTLPAEKVTAGGSYTVNVYAILGQSQSVAGGMDSFSIVPPTVTVSSATVQDYDITVNNVVVQGSAVGGVQVVSIELLENGNPVMLNTDDGALADRLVLAVESEMFSCELDPKEATRSARYSVRVRGYMDLAAAQSGTDYKCETVYALATLNGEVTSVLLGNAEAIGKSRYAFTGNTLFEVYVSGYAEAIHVTVDGNTQTFGDERRTLIGNGSYRFDIRLPLDEGIHAISFVTDRGFEPKRTHVASIRKMTETTVYAGPQGAQLKAWPTEGYGVAKLLTVNEPINLRGMCGEYAYVRVNNVNYFVHEDELVDSADDSGYRIISPQNGAVINLEDSESFTVTWDACAQADYFVVTLTDDATGRILCEKKVSAQKSDEKGRTDMNQTIMNMMGIQGPQMIPYEQAQFTKDDLGAEFDWSKVYHVSIHVVPYAE